MRVYRPLPEFHPATIEPYKPWLELQVEAFAAHEFQTMNAVVFAGASLVRNVDFIQYFRSSGGMYAFTIETVLEHTQQHLPTSAHAEYDVTVSDVRSRRHRPGLYALEVTSDDPYFADERQQIYHHIAKLVGRAWQPEPLATLDVAYSCQNFSQETLWNIKKLLPRQLHLGPMAVVHTTHPGYAHEIANPATV